MAQWPWTDSSDNQGPKSEAVQGMISGDTCPGSERFMFRLEGCFEIHDPRAAQQSQP